MSVYYYLEKTSTCSSSRSRSSSGSKLLCQRQKTWSLIISLTKARRKWFSQQNATLLLRILHTTDDDAFFFPSFKEKLLLIPSRLCEMQKKFFFPRQWLLRMQKGEKEEERLTKLLKCSRVVPFYSRHLSEDWCFLLIFSQLFQFQAYLIRNEWLHSFSDDATITELWLNSFANIQSWTTYQQPSD